VNGEIAQLVALVAYGNRALQGAGEPPDLWPENTTFRWVERVHFEGAGDSSAEWFADLRVRGVERLDLYLPSIDPALAGFAGAARGLVWASGPRPETWTGAWRVEDPQARDRRIWRVAYTRTAATGVRPATPVAAEAARALADALVAAEGVADGHDFLEGFRNWLSDARTRLTDADPAIEHHVDLVPGGWPAPARRLLAAAARGWVFGGMGS
jgi:hypothetical protein